MKFRSVASRTKIGAGIVLAIVGLTLVRWLTFDPVAWADEVSAELSPLAHLLPQAARSATSSSEVTTLVSPEFDAWRERALVRAKEMRARFHAGPTDCTRYGALDEPTPAAVDDAAEAIVQAGLAFQLSELVADGFRWRQEADDRAHALDAATEAVAYFAENANAWQRAGIWMHRDAALAELRKQLAPGPALSTRHVRLESTANARELTERHGPVLIRAATKVLADARNVDLGKSHLAFVAPGMAERELERRLGAPAERTSDTWSWSEPPLEVLLDERHEVVAVARAVRHEKITSGPNVIENPDTRYLANVLGPPVWRHDDGGHQEMVWEAGAYRRRIVLDDGTVSRVELWAKDRLLPPK